jgi:hypothetical protein
MPMPSKNIMPQSSKLVIMNSIEEALYDLLIQKELYLNTFAIRNDRRGIKPFNTFKSLNALHCVSTQ